MWTRKIWKVDDAVVAVVMLVASISSLLPSTVTSKTHVRVEWIRSCTKKDVVIGRLNVINSTLYKVKNGGSVSSVIEITDDMPATLPTDIIISKCSSSSGRDCTTLLKYPERDLCAYFKPKNFLSGAFVSNFDPPMLCPLKKGNIYRLVNSTFEEGRAASYFQAMPGEVGKVTYYIGKAQLNDGNNVIMCGEMMFRILKK